MIRQIRGSHLTTRSALLPVVAVAAAVAYYLKSFPTQGHDARLYVIGVVAGAVLGVACGAAARLSRASDGVVFANRFPGRRGLCRTRSTRLREAGAGPAEHITP
ncbi:hypothetical protein ACWD25_36110, partial [Streptomyces sp. NPDC002920]